MDALCYDHRRGPAPSEKGLRNKHDLCPVVSLCSGSIRDSPSGAIITVQDRKHVFDGVEPPRVPSNEKRLYIPTESAKARTQRDRSNAMLLHGSMARDVRKKAFNDLIKWSKLLYEPCLRANPRSHNESAPPRTDDATLLLASDRKYNGHHAPRIPIYTPTGSSQVSLID